jgi:predicted nucleic acid-binding protein
VILVDTSIWVDHLRRGDARLAGALEAAEVLMHPFVVGELACGTLNRRAHVLSLLRQLPAAPVATNDEVLIYIEKKALMGRGIGYVDAHLLASASLAPTATLWTRDKKLDAVSRDLGLAFTEP